jgi:hypothetical protein
MNWGARKRDLLRFAAEALSGAFFYALLRQTRLYDITADEIEGLNTVILLVGGIYSVMYAFVIFVIWGQFTEVENFVTRECYALNDLVRFSWLLSADVGRTVRRAVTDYAQRVHKSEWKALADRRRDRQAEKAFAELMSAVVGIAPATPQEEAVYHRLVDVVRRAGEHRDERVAKSLTRVPPTLTRLVSTMALVLILLLFVYPFQHVAAGLACCFVVHLVLSLARLVMTDTDNPFEGVCNVSPQAFTEIASS